MIPGVCLFRPGMGRVASEDSSAPAIDNSNWNETAYVMLIIVYFSVGSVKNAYGQWS